MPSFLPSSRVHLPHVLLFFASAITVTRLFLLIDHHAVNVLYWDQWDFYKPLFENRSWWEHFTWLHGPHRQGLGGLLIKLTAEASGWNTRIEAFVIGAISCLALLTALALRRRLWGPWKSTDAAIPLIVLTLSQFQIYLGASNIAYGALPSLLLLLYCLSLVAKRGVIFYGLTSVLNFLLTFTNWGIFVAPITVAVFLLDLRQRRREHRSGWPSLFGLLAGLGTIGLFLYQYTLSTAATPLPDHRTRVWEYPLFVLLMYARFVRPETGPPGPLSVLALVFGAAIALGTFVILLHHGRRLWQTGPQRSPNSLVICVLCGYCLLFAINTAIGRTSLGLNVSQSSRYMSLLLIGFLGVYFSLLSLEGSRIKQGLLAVFLVLLLPGQLPLRLGDSHPASYFSINKRAWKACYLKTGDAPTCDAVPDLKTDFVIGLNGATWKLEYLKQHHLNLFQDRE